MYAIPDLVHRDGQKSSNLRFQGYRGDTKLYYSTENLRFNKNVIKRVLVKIDVFASDTLLQFAFISSSPKLPSVMYST